MRYVKSNPKTNEWFVMLSRKGSEFVVSRHSSQEEATKACWPKY